MSLTAKQKRKLLPEVFANDAELREWLGRTQGRLDGVRVRESVEGRRAYLWTVSAGCASAPIPEAKKQFLLALFGAVVGGALEATISPPDSPLVAAYDALLEALRRTRAKSLDSVVKSTHDGLKEEDHQAGGNHVGEEGPCEEGPGDVRGGEGEEGPHAQG